MAERGSDTAERDAPGPAEVYDTQFVPALFRPWGARIAGMAAVAPGERVLDVACGTGALTCAVAARAGSGGTVVGLDANPEMLAIARRKPERVDWREGRAESLPFPDGTFDAVVSQFGLMFFDDPAAALREMRRVLRPGGRLVVAVCDAIDRSPGYSVLAELLQRLFGAAVADAFRAPFALGDAERLAGFCAAAGIVNASVASYAEQVCFPSIGALIATERACVWTLGGLLDDRQFERLLSEAEVSLGPFAGPEGDVRFEMPALVVRAER